MSKLNRAAAPVKRALPQSLSLFGRNSQTRPWLMESVSAGAILLATTTAAVGVVGLIGWGSPLAKIGTVVLVAGTLLTETAASRLPVHAERRIREGGLAGWLKGAAVIAGFGVLTAWNVIAGHFGMVAIDRAGVADARAPIERAAAIADADRETAEDALHAFDDETARQQNGIASALRGAFEAGYVTSAMRNARDANADQGRAARRERLAHDVANARSADRVAERTLARAPKGRADIELWAFAMVLELLKGALVWFATAAGGRNFPAAVQIASDPRSMSPAERRALKSRCASILASIRHLEAART